MTLPYYIIEHPTKGTFREFLDSGKPGFSWSGMRNDPDKAQRFPTAEVASRVRDRFPEDVARKCDVRLYDEAKDIQWEVVA